MARYAESSAGKNKKWDIDKNISTNPVTRSLLLGIIIPIIGFFIGLIVFGLSRDFAAKAEARKAKEESLIKYPENHSEISQERAEWVHTNKLEAEQESKAPELEGRQ